jgi:Undecaprenyl-phosphate galactose phosphotransferase WbaP
MLLTSIMKDSEESERIRRPSSFLIQHTKATVLMYADISAAIISALSSVFLSNVIRPELGFKPVDIESPEFALHASIVSAFTLALLMWFSSKGHYRRREALINRLAAILNGCAIAMACAAATQFATLEVGSRLLTASYWLILAPTLIVGRIFASHVLRVANVWNNNAVLYASLPRADEITRIIDNRDELGMTLIEFISSDEVSSKALLRSMRTAARQGSVVIYAPAPDDKSQHDVLGTLVAEGVPFIFSPQSGPVPNRAEVHNYPLEDISFLDIPDALARPIALAIKRLFDISVSSILLLIASPFFVLIALAIKLDGGPALFRQDRVGKDGDTFGCLKFRSMVLNADERLQTMIESDPDVAAEWKAYQKLRKDPRITAVGAVIRRANLDEIPQLINILRGDMSLVGPRPMTIPQIDEYGPSIAAYKRMRPGITGIWQTNGRNSTTFAERARMDAWYVRNWSLWRDFVILIRTFREVLFARGG